MTQSAFLEFTEGKVFSLDLLRDIAKYFQTSITFAAYRYLEIGQHPISFFYNKDEKLVYWKNSPNYYVSVKDITRLHVPTDSVAYEYYNGGIIYRREE